MMLSRSRFFSIVAALGAMPAAANLKPPWDPLPKPRASRALRALVLSGAGARGAYEAGALKWLYRDVDAHGPPFDIVCGSSAGAINAAYAALGTRDAISQVEALWKNMPQAHIIQLEPPIQDLVDAGEQLQLATRHGFPTNLVHYNRARRFAQGYADARSPALYTMG